VKVVHQEVTLAHAMACTLRVRKQDTLRNILIV